MRKLIVLILFVLFAIVAAGVFGVIHDQISYSIAPEYFTRFKFHQFRLLDSSVPERLRVAQVGFLASWWMGIPLGVMSGLAALVHKTPQKMQSSLAWSLPLMMGVVLMFSLVGLAYGFYQTENIEWSRYSSWYIPSGLQNQRQYLCVGYMHNAAYIGGAVAIPVAWVFHLLRKRAENSQYKR